MVKVFGNDTNFFTPVDKHGNGRCYTFNPSIQMIKNGIARLTLKMEPNRWITVFVNSRGAFKMIHVAKERHIDVPPRNIMKYDVDHNLHTMLNFDGDPCKKEVDYRLDNCIIIEMEKESMKV